MSEGKEEDPLAGLLGDDFGTWGKMFDSLHEAGQGTQESKTVDEGLDESFLGAGDVLELPDDFFAGLGDGLLGDDTLSLTLDEEDEAVVLGHAGGAQLLGNAIRVVDRGAADTDVVLGNAGLAPVQVSPVQVSPSTPLPQVSGKPLLKSDSLPFAALDEVSAMALEGFATAARPGHESGVSPSEPEPDFPSAKFSDCLPTLDVRKIVVPDVVSIDGIHRREEMSRMLANCEDGLGLLARDVAAQVWGRVEAGRLARALGDLDGARRHLEAALKLDASCVPALQSLRQVERALGRWEQVLGLLELEITHSAAMEGRALAIYRAVLLLSLGRLPEARTALEDLLVSSPADARALLCKLELEFRDSRQPGDEEREEGLGPLQKTLSELSQALRSPRLKSSVCAMAGAAAERASEKDAACDFYAAAEAASPNLGAQLGHAALLARGSEAGGKADADLLFVLRSVDRKNSDLSAGMAWQYAEARMSREGAEGVGSDLISLVPDSAVFLGSILLQGSTAAASSVAWQQRGTDNVEPALAAHGLCRAVRLLEKAEPGAVAAFELIKRAFARHPEDCGVQILAQRFGVAERVAGPELLSQVDAHHPAALEDVRNSDDPAVVRDWYCEKAEQVQSEERSREALTAAAQASVFLARLGEADDSGDIAWLEAAEAWQSVAGKSPGYATYVSLASACQSGDGPSMEVSRAQLLEHSHCSHTRLQLAIESLMAAPGQRAGGIAEALGPLISETGAVRSLELFCCAALMSDGAADAAASLSQASSWVTMSRAQADACRYRSAYFRVHSQEEVELAVQSLGALQSSRPNFSAVASLLQVARGESPMLSESMAPDPSESRTGTTRVASDSLSSEILKIESLSKLGRMGDAAERSCALLARDPEDPLVQHAFRRHCWSSGGSAYLVEQALVELRSAQEASDSFAKAKACERLARIDSELRGDEVSALMFWESASMAAPGRTDLQRVLLRHYRRESSASEGHRTLLARVISSLEPGPRRSAYLLRRAHLSELLECDGSAVRVDYEAALAGDAGCRAALGYLEREASLGAATEERVMLEVAVSRYFSEYPRAQSAFLMRAAVTWRAMGKTDQCLASLQAATRACSDFSPALCAWKAFALDFERWEEFATACLVAAQQGRGDSSAADEFLLAGVTYMDKQAHVDNAVLAFRRVLKIRALDREAFVRLRQIYEAGNHRQALADLLVERLAAGPGDLGERCELHLALASVYQESEAFYEEALVQYRALLSLRPGDKQAARAIADLAWKCRDWPAAAEALMMLARVEEETSKLVAVFSRLGAIYGEYLPNPRWALRSYHKVVSLDPGNRDALEQISLRGGECGEAKLALGACQKLLSLQIPVAAKVEVLIRMAGLLVSSGAAISGAERALRRALEMDPSSDIALDTLLEFYTEKRDMRSVQIHADRVANTMRGRIADAADDGGAYRVLARAMAAKARAGVPECICVAQVSARLALEMGVSDDEIRGMARAVDTGCGAGLGRDTFDELIFFGPAMKSVCEVFSLIESRLSKYLGNDIREHGVGRADKLRNKNEALAKMASALAVKMGSADLEVYVSKQSPLKRVAGSAHSPFLVLGTALLDPNPPAAALRFYVASALKSACLGLAAPLQLGPEKFGVLLVAILRQLHPEFSPQRVDLEAVAAEQERLHRVLAGGVLDPVRHSTLALVSGDFDAVAIWQALTDVCNRVGLICAGDGGAAVEALWRSRGCQDWRVAVEEREVAALIRFACSEEHARLWAAVRV